MRIVGPQGTDSFLHNRDNHKYDCEMPNRKCKRQAEHETLERLTEEFLQGGGTITKVPDEKKPKSGTSLNF